MRVYGAEEFGDSNCHIIFAGDPISRRKSSTNGLLVGVAGQLAFRDHSHFPTLRKYDDQSKHLPRGHETLAELTVLVNDFQTANRRPAIHDEKADGSDLSREDLIRFAVKKVEERGGTEREQTAFAAEMLAVLRPSVSQNPREYHLESNNTQSRKKSHRLKGDRKLGKSL